MTDMYVAPRRAHEILNEHSWEMASRLEAVIGIMKAWTEGYRSSPEVLEQVRIDIRDLIAEWGGHEADHRQLSLQAASGRAGHILLEGAPAFAPLRPPRNVVR